MLANTKKRSLLISIIIIEIISSQYFCKQPVKNNSLETFAPAIKISVEDLVAKGKYLVNMGGCNDCHSPKKITSVGVETDSSKLFSGHQAGSTLPALTYNATKPGNWVLFSPDLTVAIGPWGISYAANLTPDSTTGIGAWNAEIFIKTIRTGKHLGQEGGRIILPPMPWQNIAKLTDEDLTLMFVYLQTIPAIKNQVPAPVSPNELFKKNKK